MIYCLAATAPLSVACATVAISLEGSKIRRAMLGNGSGDRPLQHYVTAKQRWRPGPLDTGHRG